MGVFHKMRVALYKLKTKIKGSQIDKIRKGGGYVGENVHILASSIDPLFPFLISIGDNTTLTDVKVLAHDASTFKSLGYTKMGKVTIGKNCFIGAKTVILPNVNIGDNVIIGANSVVTKDIPSNSVAVGNPCRAIRNTDDYLSCQKEKMLEYNTINKTAQKLSKKEIEYIKNNIDGIWYIK